MAGGNKSKGSRSVHGGWPPKKSHTNKSDAHKKHNENIHQQHKNRHKPQDKRKHRICPQNKRIFSTMSAAAVSPTRDGENGTPPVENGTPPVGPPPPPVPPPPFTAAERAQLARDYFMADNLDTEAQHMDQYNAQTLADHFLPPDSPATADVRRAMREQLALSPVWNHNVAYQDLVTLAFGCWETIQGIDDQPSAVVEHPELGNGHYYRLSYTARYLLRGMVCYLPLFVVKGPNFCVNVVKNKCVNGLLAQIPIPDDVRQCIVNPMVQNIWMRGDEYHHLHLRSISTWNQLLTNKNMGNFLAECGAKAKLGVWTYEWVKVRCHESHPDYTLDRNVLKTWVQGLQYEVAAVLRFLLPGFPRPTHRHMYRCSPAQMADYDTRQLRDATTGNLIARPH